MKTLLVLTACLVVSFAVAGCQKATAPGTPASPAAAQSNSAPVPRGESAQDTANRITDSGVNEADADQPDDPGMTTDRDKTLKQEQPSGDESSQAAPNDGDAEPPQ